MDKRLVILNAMIKTGLDVTADCLHRPKYCLIPRQLLALNHGDTYQCKRKVMMSTDSFCDSIARHLSKTFGSARSTDRAHSKVPILIGPTARMSAQEVKEAA